MQRAYTMYETGYREESLRLASVALELENSKQAVYLPGEDRPSDFIAMIEASGGGKPFPQAPIAPQPAGSDDGNFRVSQGSSLDRHAAASNRQPTGRVLAGGANVSAMAMVRTQAAREQKAPASNTPHFTTSEKNKPRSAANDGQIEVSLGSTLRNADVDIITVADGGSILEASEKSEISEPVVTAEGIGDADDNASLPKALLAKSSAPTAMREAIGELDAELEPVVEVTTASHTSQLTIASTIGLLAGIGGMLGLGWWRRQERQHYATGK